MRLSLTLRSLCTPALFYLLISSFALIGILVQNIMQNGQFCVGYFSCPSSNLQKMIIFLIEVVYIVFWTWILTLICKSGYKSIAWFIVLFPFVLMFLLMALIILKGNGDVFLV